MFVIIPATREIIFPDGTELPMDYEESLKWGWPFERKRRCLTKDEESYMVEKLSKQEAMEKLLPY